MSIQPEPTSFESDRFIEVDTRFGSQMVDQSHVLSFPKGLPGLEDLHAFALFHDENNSNVFYLQSLEDADIRLPMISPENFQVDYHLTLTDEEISHLELADPNELAVLVTVARTGDGAGDVKANFNAPIILNTRSRVGLQKILRQTSGSVVLQAH